jgi:hypothetical protein
MTAIWKRRLNLHGNLSTGDHAEVRGK